MIRKLKAQFFPKGARRFLNYFKSMLFHRVTQTRLVEDLRALGIGKGDFLCMHSSMSRCGFVLGGAETVVKSFQEIVGIEGTLMVPTFTGGNSTLGYVKTNPRPFDVALTPCTTGRINEIFRQMSGAVRSYHPTHSVSSWGRLAKDLVKDHHFSKTPFGKNTPYAKLIDNRGKVVLINVNANSLVHYIQEIVDWPGHYLENEFTLPVNLGGRLVNILTKVHAPGSGFIKLPGKEPGTTVNIHFPDYALPFCLNETARQNFEKIDKNFKLELDERYQLFLQSSIVKIGSVGYGQAAIIQASEFSEKLCKDMESFLEKDLTYCH